MIAAGLASTSLLANVGLVTVNALIVTGVGRLLAGKLGKIEIHVDGRMSQLEDNVSEIKEHLAEMKGAQSS